MESSSKNFYEGVFQTEDNGNVSVILSVADTRNERMTGLMNTFWLPDNRGMLFVFPEEDERSFWMKNTYIPLDIIFLDEDFRVLNIEQADPQLFSPDSELKRYESEGEAKYVIELNKGFSQSNNISKGDYFVPGRKLSSCCV